jgi:hypothetical protein
LYSRFAFLAFFALLAFSGINNFSVFNGLRGFDFPPPPPFAHLVSGRSSRAAHTCKKIWGGPFKPSFSFGLSGVVLKPLRPASLGPQQLLFACPASDAEESAALPFVIPSEAEGSAVPRTITGNVFDRAISLAGAPLPLPSLPWLRSFLPPYPDALSSHP